MTRVLYGTIVADPPWAYSEGFPAAAANHRKKDGSRRSHAERGPIVSIAQPYPTLTVAEISGLRVADVSAPDARLFLWATSRYIEDAFTVAHAWGFTYKQLFVWDKTPWFQPLGGSVAPNAAEFLIIAVRGNPPVIGRWDSTVIRSRKARSVHSRKPDVFLDLAERVSPGPYLELFARRQRLGWDTWGDEALEHVEMGA